MLHHSYLVIFIIFAILILILSQLLVLTAFLSLCNVNRSCPSVSIIFKKWLMSLMFSRQNSLFWRLWVVMSHTGKDYWYEVINWRIMIQSDDSARIINPRAKLSVHCEDHHSSETELLRLHDRSGPVSFSPATLNLLLGSPSIFPSSFNFILPSYIFAFHPFLLLFLTLSFCFLPASFSMLLLYV